MLDLRARRLAEAVRSRLDWLADVPARRLTPTLSRFALAGWTHVDVVTAVHDARTARGWHRVPTNLERPWAYLALLLREVDPEDRPGDWEAAMDEADRLDRARRAEERALELREREYEHLRIWGPPCPHGQPAGNVPSPEWGVLACPMCRAEGGPA